ncbi:MAG: hypothetical protein ACE5KL_08240 [Alphaproteobacteria bacterium]
MPSARGTRLSSVTLWTVKFKWLGPSAVELAPDNVEANYELAKTYEVMGERVKAVASWKKVRELVANRPEHAAIAAEASEALARMSR